MEEHKPESVEEVNGVWRKVKLYTQDDGFVTEGNIPNFNKAPDVLFWGQRFFIPDPKPRDDDTYWRYVEAFSAALVS